LVAPEEAAESAKKCPNPMPGEGFTPDEQAREADLRKRIGDV
jgi:hypothetical protein